jgi:DNA-directed RNA polymerase specialized sigma24 family protein
MTMGFSSPGAQRAVTETLGRSELRSGLTALLRRRVPLQEVDDIAQTVLADALAANRVPTDPEELRRWLTGIARHKIADYYRRAARAQVDEGQVDAAFVEPTAFEEREVLHALLGEQRSRREAETMEWLIREHSGERLADIAAENELPAPVVRKRVSRLRRALRSRWTAVMGFAAVLTGLCVMGLVTSDPVGEGAIAPDPSVATPNAPAAPTDLASRAEGAWVVRAIQPNRTLSPVEQRIVDAEAMNAKVSVHGKRITLESHSGAYKMTFQVTRFEKNPKDPSRARVVVKNDSGLVETAEVVLVEGEETRLEVTVRDPRLGGKVILRRPQK